MPAVPVVAMTTDSGIAYDHPIIIINTTFLGPNITVSNFLILRTL